MSKSEDDSDDFIVDIWAALIAECMLGGPVPILDRFDASPGDNAYCAECGRPFRAVLSTGLGTWGKHIMCVPCLLRVNATAKRLLADIDVERTYAEGLDPES